MPINYELMRRESPKLKAALTRAVRSGDPDKVVAACRKAIAVWEEVGAWPDNWHSWNIALGDAAYARARATGQWSIPSHLDDLR